MYSVRSIHDYGDQIPLSSTSSMYCVKNAQIVDSEENQNNTDASLSNNGNVRTLQLRQERILLQLEELKQQLQSIRQNNKKPTAVASKMTSNSSVVGKDSVLGGKKHVVISANPKYPPLSVIVLVQMLCEKINVTTSVHVHSSVKEESQNLLKFFEKLNTADTLDPQVIITLIWKNVNGVDPMMMINPTFQSPILGEVNIARYFSHLLEASDGEASQSTVVDHLLDTFHSSVVHGNKKESQAVIRQLNAKLGESKWLASEDQPTVVDAVAWSTFQQCNLFAGAPTNVAKWLANCASHKFFQDAIAFLKD